MKRMADSLTFLNSHPPGQVVRKDGYRSETLREIRVRAETMTKGISVEEGRHLRRLNHVLEQEKSPQGNVPRGFYLNIEV